VTLREAFRQGMLQAGMSEEKLSIAEHNMVLLFPDGMKALSRECTPLEQEQMARAAKATMEKMSQYSEEQIHQWAVEMENKVTSKN